MLVHGLIFSNNMSSLDLCFVSCSVFSMSLTPNSKGLFYCWALVLCLQPLTAELLRDVFCLIYLCSPWKPRMWVLPWKITSFHYPVWPDPNLWACMLSTKIINKQSIIGIEKSFIWAKLRTIAQNPASQITLRNCSGKAGFSTQFHVLWEQRISKKSGRHSFKVSKKRIDQHVHSESAWAWHLGSGSYQRSYQNWCLRKGGIASLFLTWTFSVSG